MKKRIALLFHENSRKTNPYVYAISHLAKIWIEDGCDVFLLYGTHKYIQADLVIVHVDLSEVPEEYIKFALNYPIAINHKIKDIRKSSFSKNLVKQDDFYKGKIIVKSDLNFAGIPERLCGDMPNSKFIFKSPQDYRIYDCISNVPPHFFNNRDVVVEKFLPEIEGDLYILRHYHFLGDRITSIKIKSKQAIVNTSSMVNIETVEPHPDIITLRNKMNFDYGKFDYVIHDGQVVLLDINKTTGAGSVSENPEIIAMRRHRAEGLYSYFEKQGS